MLDLFGRNVHIAYIQIKHNTVSIIFHNSICEIVGRYNYKTSNTIVENMQYISCFYPCSVFISDDYYYIKPTRHMFDIQEASLNDN